MIIVKTPEELEKYVWASACGHINLLIIEGKGGIGKSYTIKQALKGKKHLHLSSHLTPASFYEKLYDHKDEPIFVNDIDKLFTNTTMVAIFKQLTETEDVRQIQYNSKSPLMADLPSYFETTSPVIVDANGLPSSKHMDFSALLTRGIYIKYEPTNNTLLKVMGRFAQDEEIFAWFSERIHLLEGLDFRKYVIATQLKSASMDWQDYLYKELYVEEFAVIERIGFNKPYVQRTQEWSLQTGKTPRSYDRYLKQYKKVKAGGVKRIEETKKNSDGEKSLG